MEIKVPHQVIYDTPDTVPVADVIESLIGTQRAAQELKYILEGCFDGLFVSSIQVGIKSINQESPLKELFLVSLILGFQEDLEREVPDLIEKIIGVDVPDQYDSIVTVCLLILLFYGVDFAYKKYHSVSESRHIRKQLNGLITDLSKATNRSEESIRKILAEKYSGRKALTLARSAMRFFIPSKHQSNAPIATAERKISRETISEIPGDMAKTILDPDDTSDYFSNVSIEIHAQDLDRAQQGWAATIPGHVESRVRMKIFPPVKPEDLWTRETVRGDVVVISEKQDDDELKPTMIHLLRISD